MRYKSLLWSFFLIHYWCCVTVYHYSAWLCEMSLIWANEWCDFFFRFEGQLRDAFSRPNSFLYFSSDTFAWLVINNHPCIISCIDFFNGFGFFWTWFTIFHFLRPLVAPLHDSFSSCTMFLLFMLTVHTVRYCQYMHVFSYQSKNNCSA